MATQIASRILRVKLDELRQRERKWYSDRIENLLSELENAEEDRGRDPSAENRKIGILRIIYSVEDSIDVFVSRNLIWKRNSIAKWRPFSVFAAYRVRNQFRNNVTRVLMKLPSVIDIQSGESDSKFPQTKSDERPDSSSQVGNVVNHPDDAFHFPGSRVSTISYYAPQGSGEYLVDEPEDSKIDLAQQILSDNKLIFLVSTVISRSQLENVYAGDDAKNRFKYRIWAEVPEKYSASDILIGICSQIPGLVMVAAEENLRKKVRVLLMYERYLLVLYGIGANDVWKELQSVFPNTLNGSRVILAVPETDVVSRYVDEEVGIVGMEDKIQELGDLVVTYHNRAFVISVVGARGSGKTVLTKAIYDSVKVKQHFQFRVWVFVSNATEKTILIEIFKQLTDSNEGEKMQAEELEKAVRSQLERKRYLIVLDDVHNPHVWENLKRVFPNSLTGSKVILTLRNTNETIEREPGNRSLNLRKLDRNESWMLFKKNVKDVTHVVAQDLKHRILETCDGNPLSIIVLAGLLANKTHEEWWGVLESTNPRRAKGQLTSQDGKHRIVPQVGEIKNADKSEPNRKDMVQKKSFKTNSPRKLFSPSRRQADTKKVDNGKTAATHTRDSAKSPLIGVDSPVSSSEEGMITHTDKTDVPVMLRSSDVIVEDGEGSEAEADVSERLTEQQILVMGYQDLQPELKSCLHYMGIFNSKEAVSTRRLFHLWQAEGLIRGNDHKTPEMVAEENLEELAVRGMVEVKRRMDGSSKECGIKNGLRDILFNESDQSSDYSFFHSCKEKSPYNVRNTTTIRRFVELNEQSNPPKYACFKGLRSYISFDLGRGDTPAHRVEKFLKRTIRGRGFALLTVLDLERVYKPVLLEAMGKLLQLKYLGLRWTYLDKIPLAVGDLPQLETLDLKGTNLTTLPGRIWKAKKLRHLYMNGIHFDFSARDFTVGRSIINLQTLWGLLVGIRKPSVQWLNRLDRLTELRKLGLTCHEKSFEDVLKWISLKLMKLQSLQLRCINEFSEPSSFKLKSLSRCTKLTKLYVLGRITNPIEGSMFPPCLTSLTLSISYLETDPMQVLKNLKELKVLRLLAHSYTGENMICESGTFTKLLVLKLWNLENLKELTVHGGALLELKELEIRSCNNLNQPDGLRNLKRLKEVTLTHMPQDFVTKFTSCVEDNIHVRKVSSADDSIAS